jgi:ribose/xylose/arabinose/galactoside ABC-type transport system permease subunit
MDNKVIEIFDYIGEKLGIAIDWTSENVVPQVTELIGRYRSYEIFEHVLMAVLLIIATAIMGIVLIKMWKGIVTGDDENFWYNISYDTDNVIPVVTTVTFVLLSVFAAITAVEYVLDAAKWVFIPEVQFFETLSEYMKGA